MSAKENIEELIQTETSKRLAVMEQSTYNFPKRIGKSDVVLIIGLIIISVVMIALCMGGVID